MRASTLRWFAVLGLGFAVLGVVLYLASTVDARPPEIGAVRLTQALSSDATLALTTTSIEVVFTEPVARADAEAAFALEPVTSGAFSWSGSTMLFTPEDPLPLETGFDVTLAAGIADVAGNRMAAPAPFAFRTVGRPEVVGVEPVDGAIEVALEAPIRVTFSTLMDTTTADAAVALSPDTPVSLAWRQEVLEITPLEPLRPDRRYELVIGSGLADQTGTPLAASRTTFTTVASGLSVERIVPADGTEGVAVATDLALVVDGEIDPSSLGEVDFTITPDVAGSLEIAVLDGAAGMIDDRPRVLRFSPSGSLPPTTTFTVEIGAGLRSIDGRILARELTWTFTTGAPQPTLANQIVFLSDRSGVANLWAMNADGSNERQLSSELSPVTAFAVAPNGRSFIVGDGLQLVAQAAAGGDRRVLTEAGLMEYDPAFAPDGSALVFGRADRATGSSLGIWRRPGTTGTAERLDLETAERDARSDEASPSPDASGQQPEPLLRTPRYAPDGRTLAWVDGTGAIVLLDLVAGERRVFSFVALEPPGWLPDSGSLVVAGTSAHAGGAPGRVPRRGMPILPLDAADAGRATDGVALRLVRVFRDGTDVTPIAVGNRGARIAVGPDGRIVFVRLTPNVGAGTLWLTNRSIGAALPLLDAATPVTQAAFAPEAGTLVVERVAEDGTPDGLWLLDEDTGRLARLTDEGSQPRPLP